jgi:type IV pilus assembly protein PilA
MIRPVSSRSGGPGRSSRARFRRSAPVELAIAFALCGSLIAVAAPAFVREVHASRLVEPVEGLTRIGGSAIAYAESHAPAQGASVAHPAQTPQVFPASAPMTPGAPPRGHCEVDPPDAWENPTWNALGFRPAAPGVPHCFAFAFDSTQSQATSTFRAHAHGDLDGDGIYSTFEIAGRFVEGDVREARIDPGMLVDSEVE